MSTIYRKNDILKIKVDDIQIGISPLSYHEKSQIQTKLLSKDANSIMEGAADAIKLCLRSVDGIKTQDNQDYKLTFENNKITDECFDDLMNLECNNKISSICLSLIDGIPKDFLNPQTGEVLEGVKIIRSNEPEKK